MQEKSEEAQAHCTNPVAYAVRCVGGPVQAARICERSRQAVDKWIMKGRLPRTEYTGETQYAQKLAEASEGAFSAEWLLALGAYDADKA